MFVPIVVALLSAAAPLPVCDLPSAPAASRPVRTEDAARADSTLAALYASGQDYRAFLAEAKARREMWVRNTEQAVIAPDVLATARGLMGKWRILVVAVDGCSDSVNTIPYIAKLVELVPALEMRVVLPGPGAPVMESHRTPDGRATRSVPSQEVQLRAVLRRAGARGRHARRAAAGGWRRVLHAHAVPVRAARLDGTY